MKTCAARKTLADWALVGTAAIAFGAQARADTYHRFWRGTKIAAMGWGSFVDGLNQVFIPATVQTGAGRGLIGYEPVLSEGERGLPDEFALVSYADENAYQALFSTDAGKAYQDLHWRYFDRARSHSLVPQLFSGKADLEAAYDLHPSYAGWMSGATTVLVFFRSSGESPESFAGRAASHLDQALTGDPAAGVLDRVSLVSQDYWIEFVSASSGLERTDGADLAIPLASEAPQEARILPGSGINLRFN